MRLFLPTVLDCEGKAHIIAFGVTMHESGAAVKFLMGALLQMCPSWSCESIMADNGKQNNTTFTYGNLSGSLVLVVSLDGHHGRRAVPQARQNCASCSFMHMAHALAHCKL